MSDRPPVVSGRTPAEILEGLTVPTSEPGAPPGSSLDIPIPLTAAWRAFLAQWGTGEVPTRGSALQVGGQIGIVVNLETLLGLNQGPTLSESFEVALAMNNDNPDTSGAITLPDGRTYWRLLGVTLSTSFGGNRSCRIAAHNGTPGTDETELYRGEIPFYELSGSFTGAYVPVRTGPRIESHIRMQVNGTGVQDRTATFFFEAL